MKHTVCRGRERERQEIDWLLQRRPSKYYVMRFDVIFICILYSAVLYKRHFDNFSKTNDIIQLSFILLKVLFLKKKGPTDWVEEVEQR